MSTWESKQQMRVAQEREDNKENMKNDKYIYIYIYIYMQMIVPP